MPVKTSRPYQEEALRAIKDARNRVRRMLFAMPTGTGKTYTFCALASEYLDKGPVLVLTHKKELVGQIEGELAEFMAAGLMPPALRVGVEQAGRRADGDCNVVIASVQTLAVSPKRLSWLTPALVIYDEGHHAPSLGSKKVLERLCAFEPDGPLLVGCTATPHRMDRKELAGTEKAIFEELVYNYSLLDAMKDKWVCPIRAWRGRTEVSLDDIMTQDGDFEIKKLAKKVDTPYRNQIGYELWKEHGSERPTVIFCADVAHALSVTEMWRSSGWRVESITKQTQASERAGLMDRLRSGETQVVVNVGVLAEGFNYPPFSCVLMLRPTKSWSLYVQMTGRGTRLAEGKEDLMILDMADNTKRHSLILAPRLVGLPSRMDIQGRTMLEAHDAVEAFKSAARVARGRVAKVEDFDTLDEMECVPIEQEVESLSPTQTPAAGKGVGVPIGFTSGKWTVIGLPQLRTNPNGTRNTYQECRCVCGYTRFCLSYKLRKRVLVSCLECQTAAFRVRMTIHGESNEGARSHLYKQWGIIKNRAGKPYPDWQTFQLFQEWANKTGYTEGAGYRHIRRGEDLSPTNTKWVAPKNVLK